MVCEYTEKLNSELDYPPILPNDPSQHPKPQLSNLHFI